MRDRLRILAWGGSDPDGLDALGLAPEPAEPDPADATQEEPPAARRQSVRPVVVAVAATALAAWVVVRLTSGGSATSLELVPGTPVPSVSGVLAGPGTPTTGGPSPSAQDPSAAAGVVVQVLGQVRRPGLVTLPAGSRVADAVRAAGGLVRGGSSGGLNLARPVTDGEQIVVSPDAAALTAAAGATSVASPSSVVDLNAATATDLDTLPGVGPVMASRILDWRTAHGRFASVDQLREVSGIGSRTFERLRPHVRV